MPATGYIQVHAYSSYAELPLQGVAISITTADGAAVALRMTDRSGRIDQVSVSTPDVRESQSPNPDERPFTIVDLHASVPGYEQITIENLQVFPGVTTIQNLELIPLSELPGNFDQSETFDTPSQNL